MIIANCGDSRGVCCVSGKPALATQDHKVGFNKWKTEEIEIFPYRHYRWQSKIFASGVIFFPENNVFSRMIRTEILSSIFYLGFL